jgi:hypothetical protein
MFTIFLMSLQLWIFNILRKKQENLCRNILPPSCYSNTGSLNYKAGFPTTNTVLFVNLLLSDITLCLEQKKKKRTGDETETPI